MKKDRTIYMLKIDDMCLPTMFRPSRFTWNEPDKSKTEDMRDLLKNIAGDKFLYMYSDPFHWHVFVASKAATALVKLYIPNAMIDRCSKKKN